MAELEAYAGEVGDLTEAQFLMESGAGGVVVGDAGNEGAATGGVACLDELLHELHADALSLSLFG